MMLFKERAELAEEVTQWIEENNVANTPLSVISYLEAKGWLKSKDERWIPILEKLPDKSGFYNVSVINMYDRAYTKCAYYNRNHDYWHAKQKIIAWMPSLEPYRSEQDGK